MEPHVDELEIAGPLASAFVALSEETKDLYCVSQVDRIEKPSPLEFYREYVAQNKPVIITNGFDHWKALSRWTNDYLRKKIGSKSVTVDITPKGHGDCVVNGGYFVKPVEKVMPFNDFMDFIERKSNPNGVYYIQHQNGNFFTEFSELAEDIDEQIDWVNEAFGMSHDVVNMWMGDDRAVSSLHKDHYENIYVVVTGEKHFTLLPPTDNFFLYENQFKSATYVETPEGFRVQEDEPASDVPWIPVDPDNPDLEKYPMFKYANPVRCVLYPGEMLYLPSMYYHKVSQKADAAGRTIASFRYDMRYGANWCYFKFLENVVAANRKLQQRNQQS
eukprot:TRINITY_DN7973_c0_g1_i2.p1 TRINITY_DN7973_c0_g1~~TRINITY_DN7973_c0_g1_i2.p1  ORF type:complete len:331 (-),score=63.27 TRINITY_DN7973_c0_g1_i2:214-1206(-)